MYLTEEERKELIDFHAQSMNRIKPYPESKSMNIGDAKINYRSEQISILMHAEKSDNSIPTQLPIDRQPGSWLNKYIAELGLGHLLITNDNGVKEWWLLMPKVLPEMLHDNVIG